MAKRVRGFETVGDMLRSLAVVGVFVAVILLITLRQTPDQDRPVDTAPVVAAVTDAAPFAASLPGPTPEGWTPTSARVTLPTDRPYTWYIGYLTDADEFVAVTQAYGDPTAYLRAVGADGEPAGSVEIDGRTWTKREDADGARRALVLREDDVTTIVVGTAPFDVLQERAAALEPVKR